MKRKRPLKTSLLNLASLFTLMVSFALTLPAIAMAQIPSEILAEERAAMEENIKVAKALEELLDSMRLKPFTYQTEGRADPFMPFISEQVIQEVAEIAAPEKLTGMRQFEPGQLTLVAIIFSGTNPMAMVEDSSHKGYIVRKGTKIGKSGIISDILPNQVIIKQLSYSMLKEKKYSTVEMTLRKEGEK